MAASVQRGPLCFLDVSEHPVVAEPDGSHDDPETATAVARIPVVFTGRIASRGETDYYALEAKAGETITFEAISGLPSIGAPEGSAQGFDPQLQGVEQSGGAGSTGGAGTGSQATTSRCGHRPALRNTPQSYRNVTMGSTLAARRAGRWQAATATAASRNARTINVTQPEGAAGGSDDRRDPFLFQRLLGRFAPRRTRV